MAPPLRIELRRGAARLLFAACAAAGVILLFVHPDAWSGRWSALASYLRTELIILAPLAVVFGAWVGGRERRRRLGDLLASTPRPRWQPALAAWAALGAAALAAYAVPLAVGAVLVAPTATYGGGGWPWTVAVGALGLLAAVALGLATGRLVPIPVAVPVAGVATFIGVGLLTYLPDGSRLQQLSPGGQMLADFDRVRVAGLLGQAAWFTGLTAGLLVLAAGRHRALALLPLALGLALALPMLAGGREALYRPDPSARALICAGSRPQVCLTRVHAYQLGQVTPAVTSVTSSLRGIVSPMPARAVEPIYGRPRRGDAGILLPIETDVHGRLRDLSEMQGDLLLQLLPKCDTGPGATVHAWQASDLLRSLVADSTRPSFAPAALVARVRALPAQARHRRIAAYVQALRSCDTDLLAAWQ